MKNLIIGTATGYSADVMKVFVKSARKFHPDDDIALVIDFPPTPEMHQLLSEHGIIELSYQISTMLPGPIHNIRYFRYLDFLMEHPDYKDVFLCDTRDLAFQGNVFSESRKKYLYCFFEDERHSIVSEPGNRTGMLLALGKEALLSVANQRIICWGTVLGDRLSVLHYLFKYRGEMTFERLLKDNHLVKDQAIPTLIAYLDNTPGFEMKENGDIVATVGLTSHIPETIELVGGEVLATYAFGWQRLFTGNITMKDGRIFAEGESHGKFIEGYYSCFPFDLPHEMLIIDGKFHYDNQQFVVFKMGEYMKMKGGELYYGGKKAVVVHQFDRHPFLMKYYTEKYA